MTESLSPSALSFVIPWFKLGRIALPGPLHGYSLQAFGLFVALGVVLGIWVTRWRARRLGLNDRLIVDFIAHVVIIGFIGSHVFERVAYRPHVLLEDPWDLLMPWRSMSSYGGFLFAVVAAFIWKWRRRLDITIPLDQVAFAMPVGWFFGRVGCFVVHDHPGSLTTFFLAVDHYQYRGLAEGTRHDLGLYEALWSAAVIVLFFRLDRRSRPHGFYIAVIGLLYAPIRFLLDFLRAADAVYLGLTPAQYLCVPTLLLCAWLLRHFARHQADRIPAEFRQWPPPVRRRA